MRVPSRSREQIAEDIAFGTAAAQRGWYPASTRSRFNGATASCSTSFYTDYTTTRSVGGRKRPERIGLTLAVLAKFARGGAAFRWRPYLAGQS